jgi:hypothetical protein
MYADTNKGWMFWHQNSGVDPSHGYWTPGSGSYIPFEQREAGPIAYTTASTYGGWQWDHLGGPKRTGAPFDGMYPTFMASGDVFDCASIHNFAFKDLAGYAGWINATRFRTSMRPLLDGESGGLQFWSPYTGSIFGRIDQRASAYGASFWSSYWIQGYYPYLPEYCSSPGAIFWEVGSYAFYFGGAGTLPQGAHYYGGNELFIDGSVRWKKYTWIAGN